MGQIRHHIVWLALILGSVEGYSADFFAAANGFFAKYVKEGQVAYASLHENPASLEELVKTIAAFDLKSADDGTKKAFMINAYNILAIKGIIDHYPAKSPLKINNFFDAKVYTVAGEKLSLNQLEKERLYPFANDPRLHFVLVCAAVSCPKLASFAYTPKDVEEQVEEQTKATLNDGEFIKVKGSKVELSEIFRWYEKDFKKDGKSVLAFINTYREEKFPVKTRVGYYTYNWNLNTQ